MIMGNLKEQTFDEIWHSNEAEKTRRRVLNCNKECWMIGSAAPAMKKRIIVPAKWVAKNKLRLLMNPRKKISLDSLT